MVMGTGIRSEWLKRLRLECEVFNLKKDLQAARSEVRMFEESIARWRDRFDEKCREADGFETLAKCHRERIEELRAEIANWEHQASQANKAFSEIEVDAARGRAAMGFLEGAKERLSWKREEDCTALAELASLSCDMENAAYSVWRARNEEDAQRARREELKASIDALECYQFQKETVEPLFKGDLSALKQPSWSNFEIISSDMINDTAEPVVISSLESDRAADAALNHLPPLLVPSQEAHERIAWKPSRHGEAFEVFVDGTRRGQVWLHRDHQLYQQGVYGWSAEPRDGDWAHGFTQDFAEAMRNAHGIACGWLTRTKA